jgi:hypothetical protein
VFERMRWVHRGVRGGGARGVEPAAWGSGGNAPEFFFCLGKRDTYLEKCVTYLGGFFNTWFCRWFSIFG